MRPSATPDTEIAVDATYVDDRDALAADWQRLQAQADHSFFQSWGWIGCWLRHLPRDQRLVRLTARRAGAIVGLGVFGERRTRRRGVIVSHSVHLHAAGAAPFDSLTIEHNGILANRECESSVRRACVQWLITALRERRWDEVYLPGVEPAYGDTAAGLGATVRTLRLAPSPYVDLAQLRARRIDYLDALSKKARQQIRQQLQRYEKHGHLSVRAASSPAEALEFLDALTTLHATRWSARRQESAFLTPFARAFHRDLIESRCAAGDVELLRVSAGNDIVGYLYNFVYRGRVYFYQSGLQYEWGREYRPGYVCLCLAVQDHLERGSLQYDMLFGKELYKHTLATHRDERAWLVLQRDRVDFRLEAGLRRLKQRFMAYRPGNSVP